METNPSQTLCSDERFTLQLRQEKTETCRGSRDHFQTRKTKHTHTHHEKPTHRKQNGGQFRVQYLAQGHLDTQTGGAGDQTTNLLISGRTAVPPEPRLPLN